MNEMLEEFGITCGSTDAAATSRMTRYDVDDDDDDLLEDSSGDESD